MIISVWEPRLPMLVCHVPDLISIKSTFFFWYHSPAFFQGLDLQCRPGENVEQFASFQINYHSDRRVQRVQTFRKKYLVGNFLSWCDVFAPLNNLCISVTPRWSLAFVPSTVPCSTWAVSCSWLLPPADEPHAVRVSLTRRDDRGENSRQRSPSLTDFPAWTHPVNLRHTLNCGYTGKHTTARPVCMCA